MSRKAIAILVAVAMVTVFVPVSAATHFSTGYEDTVATGAVETPNSPSVAGDETGTDDTPYGVGTKESGCYDADATVSADEATDAATTDGFCGELVYQEDTNYKLVSPPDQEIVDDGFIGDFDVQRTYFVGFGIGLCEPMCDDGDDAVSAQNLTWNAVHTAGSEAGVTDGPGDAHGEEDGRFNSYVVAAQTAHAPGVVQRNTNLWEMNGWVIPSLGYGGSFVGFLEDNEGNVIDDDRLQREIQKRVDDGRLSPETEASICGYTPDRQFQSTGEQGFCESPLLYVPPDEGPDPSDPGFDDYDDSCESPTYVCGESTEGGYWESEAVGLAGAYGGRYQGEHMRWHWVIAPNQPDCPNMEPGFDFGPDRAEMPYLAHDLDVYTPPQRLSAFGDQPSTDNLYSIDDGEDGYANSFIQESPDVPAVPIEETEEQAESTAEPVRKGDVLEPNHASPAPSGIDDNSRVAISEDRTLGQGCSELGQTETDATKDPWVNYLDTSVSVDRTLTVREPVVEERAPPTKGGVSTAQYGLYGSQDDEHDGDNDPTTDLYSTSGNVGMFTDKNDDGEYDVVVGPSNAASGFGAGVYSGGNIEATGAYPMLWDMHVNETDSGLEVDETSGCSGPSSQEFAKTMKQAGYGPNTGLAQAIYLREPTVFEDSQLDDADTAVYDGNNIYVLLNDAARTAWDGEINDGGDDTTLGEEVDALVENLRTFVVTEHEAPTASLEVKEPGADLGLDSDFFSQCGTDTGGYSLSPSFLHSCRIDCSGDTIATMYTFEVDRDVGTIGGGPIPGFQIDGSAYDFGTGQHTWYDVDPFDGDADRNEQRMTPPSTAQ